MLITKKPSSLKSLLSTLLLLSAVSCTPKPPDVPVCEDLQQRLAIDPKTSHVILSPDPVCMKQIREPSCGHCTTIVSGKESYYGEQAAHYFGDKPWSKVVFIKVPAKESYFPLEKYIINSCDKLNCSKPLQSFKIKLDALNGVSGALKNH